MPRLSTERELGTDSVDTGLALKPDGLGGVAPGTVAAGEVDRFPGQLLWSAEPTAAGDIYVRGWYIQTDAAAAIASGSPLTPSEPGYGSRYVVNLSGVTGAPFTLRFTGTSVNRITGAVTPADTDDIAVTGNGYYQTEKWFIDAPTIEPVEAAKSATADVYRVNYVEALSRDYEILTLAVEFTPDAVNWDLAVTIWHVQDDGSLVVVDSLAFDNTDTPPRAENDKPGIYQKATLSAVIDRTKKEGSIVYVDQSQIGGITIQVGFEQINPTP